MLSKFILVSETRFQNTEIALKNQQGSIQELETQISQLSKLISERPQGSLPNNTEPNPREQLNTINIQDEEGVVEPELELKQETVVSKGQGELTLRVGDKTVTLQARNSGNISGIEGDHLTHSPRTDNMVQPTLQGISLKEAHESFLYNSRGPFHKDRRLQIEELDEWRMHKPRTPDKSNLRQNELNTFPNQLKIGDRVLLDAADPHIVTSTSNEEILFTVLSIFPFGTVEVRHPKFGTFKAFNVAFTRKENRCTCLEEEEGSIIFCGSNHENSSPSPAVPPRAPGRAFPNTSGPTLNCGPLHRLGCRRFRLGGLVRQLSVPEFGTALGLYTEEFKEENDLDALTHHIHFSPSRCWNTLAPSTASYIPSCSKASVLPPSLRYLHTILAYTTIGRRESTGVVNTHDAYFLWYMSHGHIIDLVDFIVLAIQHQMEQHRKGICHHLHISSPVPPRELSSDEDV
ncbi:hypothetical protein GOBAR_AA32929 [Gossypium barbadense]|uniref:Uncharacterized protein n=1 Tax=Gossypium barbadense TaxID=3634 RepID=A0A2P5W9M3_GOSBA|nr:hypothetical protein GOBAR_AA32929 [Gossypium barbadense]